MKVAFEHDLSHNYVIPEEEEARIEGVGQENEYELHMLEENHIPGFMECVRKNINGRNRYYYEITSRQSLAQICENESLTADSIQILMRCLYQALQQLEPYLLDGNRIVLEPELIYLDIESREAVFCYWPLWKKTIQDSFRMFSSYLLYHLEQSDTEAVLLMYEVNKKVQEKNYALLELLKEKTQSDIYSRQQSESYLNADTAISNKTAQVKMVQDDLTRESIFQESDVQRLWTQEHNGQREKRNVEDGKSTGRKQKWWKKIRSTKTVDTQNKRRRKSSTEKDPDNKNRKKNKSNLAAGVVFLVVLGIVGIAARMELLTITQAGGIAFLIIGGMAYVLSPENKWKKKAKEKKTQKNMSKIDWEEPEHIPTGYERETQMQDYSARQQQIQQKGIGSQVYGAKQQSVRESAQEELMGATTVLWEGTEEYQPNLTLISMNAKERNSIVLLNDSYLIGKLKNKVDIYIDDASISRIHAKLQKENEEYYLCDMNSTNGTFVNGRRLGIQEKVPIHVADEITFADLGYYVGNC